MKKINPLPNLIALLTNFDKPAQKRFIMEMLHEELITGEQTSQLIWRYKLRSA